MSNAQRTALLIANPVAQRGNGAEASRIAADLLREGLGDDAVTVETTDYAGHAIDIAAAASNDRYDMVVALGGDGAVHEVVNGLMWLPVEARPAFGLVPVGSGNDYARTLGMSEKMPDAVRQLIGACEMKADVGVCNGEYFAETLSFGLDAAIALDTVERRKRTGQQGTILYMMSGIDILSHHLEEYRFEAVLDEERPIGGRMLMFAVQNGVTYGGGFRICPEARVDDGVLDICYAEAPMSVPVATLKFLRAKNGHHVNLKGIRFERASKIELKFDKRPPCQIDGEAHIADSYSIEVVPSALRVLCASA